MDRGQIKEMIDKANERLESAEVLHSIGNFSDSISRSYYAILDAARAALVVEGIYPKSQAGIIQKFHEHYIKTGKMSEDFGKILAQVESARAEADYAFEINFTSSESSEILVHAQKFVREIEKILSPTED